MENATATKTSNAQIARELFDRHLSLDAGVRGGAIPKMQAQWTRNRYLLLEAKNGLFIRRGFDEAMAMVAGFGGDREYEIGQHCDSGLFYAWPKSEGEPQDVTNMDPDDLGGGPFVNTVTVSA